MGYAPESMRFVLTAFLFLAALVSACACSVPVFRYALERWPPDPFLATIYHEGSLSVEEESLVASLEASPANLNVVRVDLATTTDPAVRAVWDEQETSTLPWLYVTYPTSHPIAIELEAGPLAASRVKALLNTPVRQGIADALVAGETAVWVLLESGDTAKDAAAWKTLTEQLRHLESTLELPDVEQEDIDAGLLALDEDQLKIAFSAQRVSRTDPQDEIFVRMLLDTEDDLLDSDDPMIFPIFGRGRILYAIVGDGIEADTLRTAASYLVGACSCQVKADNPGVDMLMSMPWDDLVESTAKSPELPELAGIVPEPPKAEPPVSTTEPTADRPPMDNPPVALAEDSSSHTLLWTTLGTLLLMLLGVAASSTLFQQKTP